MSEGVFRYYISYFHSTCRAAGVIVGAGRLYRRVRRHRIEMAAYYIKFIVVIIYAARCQSFFLRDYIILFFAAVEVFDEISVKSHFFELAYREISGVKVALRI